MKITIFPIKTRLITEKDDIENIVDVFAKKFIEKQDIVVIAESPLAITQGRVIKEDNIHISFIARLLWRFVARVPYGVGLRSPESMQCAINESGGLRIIVAALISGVTKPFGVRGLFYRIAGKQAAMIDAAHTTPVKPFHKCVILGPRNPDSVCQKLKKRFGVEFAIMDINDIGGSWVIGNSGAIPVKKIEQIMKINPLGQGKEMTPIGIVRGLL